MSVFDSQILLSLAGIKTFEKGVSLVKNNKVLLERISKEKVTASVLGTVPYSVMVSMGTSIHSTCNCPAADYQEMCKHAVAVALVAWDDTYKTKDTQTTLPSLRDWLANKPAEALVDIALSLIEADPQVHQLWLERIQISLSPLPASELKKRITKAMPKRHLWDSHKVANYFDVALSRIQVIKEGMEHLHADEQWPLLNYAEQRLYSVLESIDDSYGYRLGLEDFLRDWQRHCFDALSMTDAKKAEWLFEQFFQEYTLQQMHNDLAIENNTSVMGHFFALCEAALHEEHIDQLDKWRLAQPLINKAKEEHNWQEESRLKAIIATSMEDWLELCGLHLLHQDEFTAEDWLIKAKKSAVTLADKNRCLKQEIDVCIALGEQEKAWQCGKHWFETAASFAAYLELENYKAQLALDEDLTDWVEATLQAKFANAKLPFEIYRASQQLLEYYDHSNQLDKAKHQAELGPIDNGQLLALCHKILKSDADWAFSHYFQALSKCISRGNNQAYQEASDMLDEIEKQCLSMAVKGRMEPLIDSLKIKFKAKRNMLALLQHRTSVV